MEAIQHDYSKSNPAKSAADGETAKILVLADKIAARNGGLFYLNIFNKGNNHGQFAAAAVVCSLKELGDGNEPFWIFACPLWQFRGTTRLEPGTNLIELAAQGYSPVTRQTAEWTRHISYVFEMAKLRTMAFLKKNPTPDASDQASRIFKYIQTIADISSGDDGMNYQHIDAINDTLSIQIEVTMIDPEGNNRKGEVALSSLGTAFWLANYASGLSNKHIADFNRELINFPHKHPHDEGGTS